MSLRDLDLKPQYDSITDDVYGDFFNKVFKHSLECARVGGRFTSRNFAACAEGMQEFIQLDGTMRLVLLPEFTKGDIDAINRGIRRAQDVLSEKWISDLSEVKDKFVENHTKALAWMLANGNLEIKIVVPERRDGSVVSCEELRDSQVFRNKTGIFWDKNNAVSFSGNIEFDDKMVGEYYHFRVYRGWDEGERKYVDHDLEEFYRYWDGQEIDAGIVLKTLSMPDAVRDSLLRIAPKSKSEIKLQNVPRLRPYQKEAVRMWDKNASKGVFEMATGTGKTFTAIGCIEKAKEKDDRLLVVVACPFDNLERQWKRELEKWNIKSMVTSGMRNWLQSLTGMIASLEVSKNNEIAVVITTYKTFSSDKFVRAMERCSIPTMLVADEVHNAGSSEYALGLTDAYKYRLGLSATLERYFDPVGTELVRKFFDKTVYEMSLKSAIQNEFLVGYHYHLVFTDLNSGEYEEYRSYTTTIAKTWNSKKPEHRELLKNAMLARSRIVRDATSKIERFRELVDTHKDNMGHTLAYCSEKQMAEAKRILSRHGIVNREITAKKPSNPKQREEILKDFSAGHYDVIVANRVLDEGADVPAAKRCVMLANTGNPKQFIQRRGRVLRKFTGTYGDGSNKEHADIHDMLVIPSLSSDYTPEEIKTERQIVASQIGRLEEMADAAINRDECMEIMKTLKARFSL